MGVVQVRSRRWAVAVMLGMAVVTLGACGQGRSRVASDPAVRPAPVTVPQLRDWLEQGEQISVLLAKIDGSGTVYRLSMEQRSNLRAEGMPASLLGHMEATYDGAMRANPDLEKSDEHWIRIGDYWYGGLPAGWPREWVLGIKTSGTR